MVLIANNLSPRPGLKHFKHYPIMEDKNYLTDGAGDILVQFVAPTRTIVEFQNIFQFSSKYKGSPAYELLGKYFHNLVIYIGSAIIKPLLKSGWTFECTSYKSRSNFNLVLFAE